MWIAGKHYTDPELLEINTLENAIYMTIKNDVSFLIDGRLSLYEHQSTRNPNLPLRFLFYISHLYSRMTKDANLYGTAKVQIPAPEFVVFYNSRECIREDVLKEFLENHRAEAKAMSIFEYDQEKHMRQEREAGIKEGEERLLTAQIQKKLAKGKEIAEIAEELEETEEHIRLIIEKLSDCSDRMGQ